MIELRIDGKDYKVPEDMSELTLEQYCRAFYNLPSIDEGMDEVERLTVVKRNQSVIMSRILGEPDEFCLDIPLELFAHLNEALMFVYDVDFFMKNARAGVRIDGRYYSIPPLDKMSMRQYIDADVVMKQESDHQFIELLAVLLLPTDEKNEFVPYTGEYKKMMVKVGELPCSEALPLVYHFFKRGKALNMLSRLSMKEEVNQPVPSTQGS